MSDDNTHPTPPNAQRANEGVAKKSGGWRKLKVAFFSILLVSLIGGIGASYWFSWPFTWPFAERSGQASMEERLTQLEAQLSSLSRSSIDGWIDEGIRSPFDSLSRQIEEMEVRLSGIEDDLRNLDGQIGRWTQDQSAIRSEIAEYMRGQALLRGALAELDGQLATLKANATSTGQRQMAPIVESSPLLELYSLLLDAKRAAGRYAYQPASSMLGQALDLAQGSDEQPVVALAPTLEAARQSMEADTLIPWSDYETRLASFRVVMFSNLWADFEPQTEPLDEPLSESISWWGRLGSLFGQVGTLRPREEGVLETRSYALRSTVILQRLLLLEVALAARDVEAVRNGAQQLQNDWATMELDESLTSVRNDGDSFQALLESLMALEHKPIPPELDQAILEVKAMLGRP